MPDREKLCAVCDRYIEAVGAGDADAVMDLYADEPRIEDPVGTEPRVGRDAVRAFYENLRNVKPRTRRIGPVTVVGSNAAFQFSIEVPLGDETLRMTATDVMTFDDDGRILTMVAYPDAEARPDDPV